MRSSTARLLRLALGTLVCLPLGACNRAGPPTAPDAMLVEQGTIPPSATGATARWAGVGHAAQGSVRFSAENGVGRLEFSPDFSVSAVPGPFVYVNTTNNANTGRPLRVSALARNAGAQTYTFQLPAGVTYAWVLVWCDPFNVPVAEARMAAAP